MRLRQHMLRIVYVEEDTTGKEQVGPTIFLSLTLGTNCVLKPNITFFFLLCWPCVNLPLSHFHRDLNFNKVAEPQQDAIYISFFYLN